MLAYYYIDIDAFLQVVANPVSKALIDEDKTITAKATILIARWLLSVLLLWIMNRLFLHGFAVVLF